jgi:hypothetical protein
VRRNAQASDPKIQTESGGVSDNLTGTVADPLAAGGIDLTLALDAASVDKIGRLAGIPLGGDPPVSLTGRFLTGENICFVAAEAMPRWAWRAAGSPLPTSWRASDGRISPDVRQATFKDQYITRFGSGLFRSMVPGGDGTTDPVCGVVRFDIRNGIADARRKIAAQLSDVTWFGSGPGLCGNRSYGTRTMMDLPPPQRARP